MGVEMVAVGFTKNWLYKNWGPFRYGIYQSYMASKWAKTADVKCLFCLEFSTTSRCGPNISKLVLLHSRALHLLNSNSLYFWSRVYLNLEKELQVPTVLVKPL